jgi:hypothetical protein
MIKVIVGIALSGWAGCAGAADVATALFDGGAPIAVTLEGPFGALARDTAADPAYREVTLVWKNDAGADVRIPLKAKPRGNSRRRQTACHFPPLRLNFPKGAPHDTPFTGLDKVKMVTHCGRLGDSDPQYATRVRLELLLYRVFNRVSPQSLRVRELTVTYVDADHGNRRSVQPAFLIEPEEMLATRLGMRRIDVEAIDRKQLDGVQAGLVEMFEYLAGNTDFSLTRGPAGDRCCHNVVMLATTRDTVAPVPYDFDSTGVVDAPYALPAQGLGIQSVRQRLYRGYCRSDAELQATVAVFDAARDDVYALFRSDAVLDARTIARTTEYLDEFYAVIDDPQALRRKVSSHCL